MAEMATPLPISRIERERRQRERAPQRTVLTVLVLIAIGIAVVFTWGALSSYERGQRVPPELRGPPVEKVPPVEMPAGETR